MIELSIVVPIYNVDKYLENCIKSILSQNFKDFEVILVNDGSTDNSLSICKRYERIDSRVEVIDKENGGVSSARNVGIDRAKGKYIAFVDPDDDIEINMYEKLIRSIKKLNVDIVVSSFKYIDLINNRRNVQEIWNRDNEIIYRDEINEILRAILHFKGSYGVFSSFNKIYNREVFTKNNIRFDENKHHGEDMKLNLLLLLEVNSIAFLNIPLYNYYIRDRKSLTQIFRKDMYEYILDSRKLYMHICRVLSYNEFNNFINIHYLNETIEYMIQTVKANIGLKEKRKIIKDIMRDNTFTDFIKEYKAPYRYYKILKLFSINRKVDLFIISVKALLYKEKLNELIKG